MIDPLDMAAWQKVAIAWLRLAETAEAGKKKTAPAQAQSWGRPLKECRRGGTVK